MSTNPPAFTQGLVMSKVEAEGFFPIREDEFYEVRSVVYVIDHRCSFESLSRILVVGYMASQRSQVGWPGGTRQSLLFLLQLHPYPRISSL